MGTTSPSPPPVGVVRVHALMAGALTFVIVVLALGAYGWVTHDACLEEARRPVDTARWSGSQRLAAWPPAAMRCTWTAPSGSHVSWTITEWPLWIVYGAIALAALVAAREWIAAAWSRRS
jgi:hypothetical protein